MTYKTPAKFSLALPALLLALGLACAGCSDSKADPKAEAPPPANVEREENTGIVATAQSEAICSGQRD